ncbi:MAG TPA: DUF4810 domain-containing protein [Bacteroidota bacterium]|nr:DUF4810 domain-containing protein [Bacteroidota bacterium]
MKYPIFILSTVLLFLIGCVPPGQAFFWGDYSSTLYSYKKTPDEKTLAAHKESLLLIITESPKKKLPVPPGVYAEYGYMLVLEGKEAEGLGYLDKELSLYPESGVFIARFKQAYQKKGGS